MIQWKATSKAKPPTEPGGNAEPDDDDQLTPNPKNKIKYTCSSCGQNAWAHAQLICGGCAQPMIAQ